MQLESNAPAITITTVERAEVSFAGYWYRFERDLCNADNGIAVYRTDAEIGEGDDDLLSEQLVDALEDDGTSLRKVAKRWMRGFLGTV